MAAAEVTYNWVERLSLGFMPSFWCCLQAWREIPMLFVSHICFYLDCNIVNREEKKEEILDKREGEKNCCLGLMEIE